MTELWRLNITTIAKNPKVQNFFIRTLVTAFLVPITFLVIWAGGWWLTVLITICAILGGWELASLVASDKGKLIKFICSIWSGALVVVMHLYLEDFGFMFTVFPVLVSIPFVLMICTFWKVLVTKQDALRKLFQITSSLSKNSFVALVVGGLLSFALLLNDLQAGRDWIYSIIVVVAATDVASYIFGSLFLRFFCSFFGTLLGHFRGNF